MGSGEPRFPRRPIDLPSGKAYDVEMIDYH
jgi:hypothetical protein